MSESVVAIDFEQIREILLTWKSMVKELDGFKCPFNRSPYYHNCLKVMTQLRAIATHIETNEPLMRQWMNEYLAKNRHMIFLKSYSDLMHLWIEDQIKENFPWRKLHPDLQREWNTIFGSDHSMCFELAMRAVKQACSRFIPQQVGFLDTTMPLCDDPTIVAMHYGRNCESDGWNDCDLCEQQTNLWKKELLRRLSTSPHPLLNPEERKWYILGRWAKHKYLKQEYPDLSPSWTPPHHWCQLCYSRREHICYDYNSFMNYVKTYCLKPFKSHGETPLKLTESLLLNITCYAAWELPYSKDEYKDEYEVFMILWNRLDILKESLPLGLQRIADIEAMF